MSASVASAANATRSAFKPSFFFWMTLVMAFFVFTGFGMTYLFPLARGAFPPAPPMLYRLSLTFWMVPVGGIRGPAPRPPSRCADTPATARPNTTIPDRIHVRCITPLQKGRGLPEPRPSAEITSSDP